MVAVMECYVLQVMDGKNVNTTRTATKLTDVPLLKIVKISTVLTFTRKMTNESRCQFGLKHSQDVGLLTFHQLTTHLCFLNRGSLNQA